MQNEHVFLEYLERCAVGKQLFETKCIEGDETHYFILNNEISASVRILKLLAAHRHYYSQQTQNSIIANRLVVIVTTSILPIAELCVEVDGVIVVSNYELECLNDFANSYTNFSYSYSKCDFKFLFAYERADDNIFNTIFGVSRYITQLLIPKNIVASQKSKFKVSLKSIDSADNYILMNEIIPIKTLIIINFSGGTDVLYEPSIWDDLILLAKKSDYDIFSFARNENEILEGSILLNVSMDVLFALILRGCKVVSFQNIVTDFMRLIESQQLKALIVFKLNHDTKQLASSLNIVNEVNHFQKMRYITLNELNIDFRMLLLKNYEEMFLVDQFGTNKLIYMQGLKLANEICSDDPKIHYIIQNRHIGDAMNNLRAVRAYKKFYTNTSDWVCIDDNLSKFKDNRVVTKVVVITDSVLASVTSLCEDVDEIITISNNSLNLLEMYARLPYKPHSNLFPDISVDGKEVDYYGYSSIQKYLMLPPKFAIDNKSSFKISEKIISQTDEFIIKNNINTNKMILLIPLSRSSSSLEQYDLQLLINHCNSNGYTVYTNCCVNQKSLQGTLPLELPVDMICALASKGAIAIGAQCGLMDTLVWLENPNISGIVVMPINILADKIFANAYKVTKQICNKGNFTYIKKRKKEPEKLDELILREFKRKFENSEE